MELPTTLKNLYRHWDIYIDPNRVSVSPDEVFHDKRLFEDLSQFIKERIAIWQKKTIGEDMPYTADPIFAQYRFCNIFREMDRQTIEFHTLLHPLRNNFPLWLMNIFYCRMVARTETVQSVGLLSFDKEENQLLYKRLMDYPRPRFGTPYVFPVSTILKSDFPTRELFITGYLPTILPAIAEEIGAWHKKSVYEGVQTILPLFKYNLTFLWTEVLIDVAYQFPEYIDLFERFPVGPGSLPTLQKINITKDPTVLVKELSKIFLDTGITLNKIPLRLSAENWEGIGCEFRKYTNLKIGKGRRRLYKK